MAYSIPLLPKDKVKNMASSRKILQIGVLTVGFALSQAFRTIPTIAASGIAVDMHAGPPELATFSAAFHWSFALSQIPIGLSLDVLGVRRTALTVPWLTIIGAAMCYFAPNFAMLFVGQLLIGIGCAPALMAAMVFVTKHWDRTKFASVSGFVLAAGGTGMLLTGTPLAWTIEHWSWRAAFLVMALIATAALALASIVLDADLPESSKRAPSFIEAIVGLKGVLVGRRAIALMAIGFVSYGAAITLRGLWLVPMFMDRHHIPLVMAGNIAFAVSVVMIGAPALVGWLDPGEGRRVPGIVGMSLALAAAFFLLAATSNLNSHFDIVICLFIALVSAFYVLAYAEVRRSYPPSMVGRGLTAFNMAMFLGAAIQQTLSGFVGQAALNEGFPPANAVMTFLGVVLVLGSLSFAVLIVCPRAEADPSKGGQPELSPPEADGRSSLVASHALSAAGDNCEAHVKIRQPAKVWPNDDSRCNDTGPT
ncbi:MAG TPA: MFS transporter [Pseudolabrys sp.]|nr:MFS transporter [Pseudolabrys sp.]